MVAAKPLHAGEAMAELNPHPARRSQLKFHPGSLTDCHLKHTEICITLTDVTWFGGGSPAPWQWLLPATRCGRCRKRYPASHGAAPLDTEDACTGSKYLPKAAARVSDDKPLSQGRNGNHRNLSWVSKGTTCCRRRPPRCRLAQWSPPRNGPPVRHSTASLLYFPVIVDFHGKIFTVSSPFYCLWRDQTPQEPPRP